MEGTFLQQSWHFEPLSYTTYDDISMTQLSLEAISKESCNFVMKMSSQGTNLWKQYPRKIVTLSWKCHQRGEVQSVNFVARMYLQNRKTIDLANASKQHPRKVVTLSWKCHQRWEAQSVNFVARMFSPHFKDNRPKSILWFFFFFLQPFHMLDYCNAQLIRIISSTIS